MKNIIDEIKGNQDYIKNNPDWINNYFDIVPNLFTHHSENVFNTVKQWIEDKTTIKVEDNFINYLIEQHFKEDDFIVLKGVYLTYENINDYVLFSIDLGEQEHYFNEQNKQLTREQKDHIENETGITINDSNQYGYEIIYTHIEVFIDSNDLLNEIGDIYNEFYSDGSAYNENLHIQSNI